MSDDIFTNDVLVDYLIAEYSRADLIGQLISFDVNWRQRLTMAMADVLRLTHEDINHALPIAVQVKLSQADEHELDSIAHTLVQLHDMLDTTLVCRSAENDD